GPHAPDRRYGGRLGRDGRSGSRRVAHPARNRRISSREGHRPAAVSFGKADAGQQQPVRAQGCRILIHGCCLHTYTSRASRWPRECNPEFEATARQLRLGSTAKVAKERRCRLKFHAQNATPSPPAASTHGVPAASTRRPASPTPTDCPRKNEPANAATAAPRRSGAIWVA